MNDVAAAAGVALKTVSRVVNNEPGVNIATAERVQAAIDRLGYRRNDSARTLRSGRTASIGLVIEDVADPFYSGLSRAVEDLALRQGYLVFTGSSGEDPARERELVLAFCARRVDGLIIVPAGTDHGYLSPEFDAGIAAVFADRPPGTGCDADTVLCDNAGGAQAGIRHLISHGHRRIAFFADSPAIFTATERLYGYRQALAAAALPYDEGLVAMGPPEQARVQAGLERLLAAPDPPTALLTGNGRTTVAILRALSALPSKPVRHGGRLTDLVGMAVVGFDDFELADVLGITVVAQDPSGLGRTAAELLFRRMSGDVGPSRRVELPTRIIARGSGEVPPRQGGKGAS
ncbi:LacI family transcriptional regulator [Planotetraspora sp. A-T 1434]|uniref:LacI family DNA-binding transcriptional regulator n=1 Tax=Planotetraspora sp. A-T 1434 TaxID=2979219 RepID=UPI0021C0AB2B|nr:LacI family DNA-binding transcriptional regulator [Planotetraspora sp. A-T 1434]MCT9933508.1 LacI family transcriptional regulator [Planotetraspora sp. A-T 1434]